MHEFLSQIKALSVALASLGSPIMLQEHIDSILKGLRSDYHSIIAIIESEFKPLPIEQVEALLLAHEARLNKFTKQTLSGSPSINYSQTHHKSSAYSFDVNTVPNKSFLQTDPESFPTFRGGSGRGGGFNCGGGGVGHFANFQCQVCLKFGHIASVCHY